MLLRFLQVCDPTQSPSAVQRLMLESSLQKRTKHRPLHRSCCMMYSGIARSAFTASKCLSHRARSRPALVSQMRIVLSFPPVTRSTTLTPTKRNNGVRCPLNKNTCPFFAQASQTLTVLSALPVPTGPHRGLFQSYRGLPWLLCHECDLSENEVLVRCHRPTLGERHIFMHPR